MLNLPHTVTRSVLLAAAPAEVWEALTDESILREWLAAEVEIEPREGGELVCRYEDGEERRGEVTWSRRPNASPSSGGAGARDRAGSNSSSTPSPTAPA